MPSRLQLPARLQTRRQERLTHSLNHSLTDSRTLSRDFEVIYATAYRLWRTLRKLPSLCDGNVREGHVRDVVLGVQEACHASQCVPQHARCRLEIKSGTTMAVIREGQRNVFAAAALEDAATSTRVILKLGYTGIRDTGKPREPDEAHSTIRPSSFLATPQEFKRAGRHFGGGKQ